MKNKQTEWNLGLLWCSEEAHRQVGGRWKDGRMGGCPLGGLDGRLMPRWVDGSLSLDEARWVCLLPRLQKHWRAFQVVGWIWSQAKPGEKSDASSYEGKRAKKNDLCEGCKWCLGKWMVGGPFQPLHLGGWTNRPFMALPHLTPPHILATNLTDSLNIWILKLLFVNKWSLTSVSNQLMIVCALLVWIHKTTFDWSQIEVNSSQFSQPSFTAK